MVQGIHNKTDYLRKFTAHKNSAHLIQNDRGRGNFHKSAIYCASHDIIIHDKFTVTVGRNGTVVSNLPR